MSGKTNPKAKADRAQHTKTKKPMKQTTIKLLAKAVFTGKYPPGTKARDLASIKVENRNPGDTALHIAACHGYLPPGTTNTDLLRVRNSDGLTPLHAAAAGGNLLAGTTVADLICAKSNTGWTALHMAAAYGNLPLETTVQDLATTCDNNGTSAFYAAAFFGHLPAGTTAQELRDNVGRCALEVLAETQVVTVLNNTIASDEDELHSICGVLMEKYPLETQEWAQREQNRFAAMN